MNGRTIFIVLFLNAGPNFFPNTVPQLKRFDLDSTYLFGANFAPNEYQVHMYNLYHAAFFQDVTYVSEITALSLFRSKTISVPPALLSL